MGKYYNLCYGTVVDKTPKWHTTSQRPKWNIYETHDQNMKQYKKWREIQPPIPEKVVFCNKCGKKYSSWEIYRYYARPHKSTRCYNRIDNNNQQEDE